MKKGPVQQKQRKSKAKKCRHPWYKKPVRFTFHQSPVAFFDTLKKQKKKELNQNIYSPGSNLRQAQEKLHR